MLKRKIYNKLVEWKEKSGKESALLIEGARRVGKTTIAEFFGHNNFKNTVKIDFSKADERTIKLFSSIPSEENMDSFFGELFLSIGIKMPPRDSLIIFDEIQFCPKARQAIKHLVKDGRYYYIETGSLISIKENTKNILIPSEEESIEMLPMDFEEFLMAIEEEHLISVLKDILDNKQYDLEKKYHHEFMKKFKTYLAVGGMPQAVSKYVETRDFLEVHRIKMNIINLYKKDLDKMDSIYHTICKRMWDLMPSFLTKHKTKFAISKLGIRKESVLLQKTISTIVDSKMVYFVPMCSEPKFGMKLTESSEEFKLYFNDIGLFTAILFEEDKDVTESIYQKLVFSKVDANLGMLYENAVCQMLRAKGYATYFYKWSQDTDGKNKFYEIDFLITRNAKPYAIEVKKSKNYTTTSLNIFMDKYRVNKGVILSPKALDVDGEIAYIPLYMAFLL